jgi:hypothetical protein
MSCKGPADMTEHDLTWLWGSLPVGLSSDGDTVYFTEPLSVNPDLEIPLYRRRLDGSPAVRVGEGRGGHSLSPDGRWLLTSLEARLVVLPTGAGSPITLPNGPLRRFGAASWLGDSNHIVYTADTGDGRPRGYLQEVPTGLPQAITPSGVVLPVKAAVRDDRSVLARAGARWLLMPLGGGEGRPVPALTPRDVPVQWSDDGRYVYTVDTIDPTAARPVGVDVHRVDVATGSRTLWHTLAPSDPVGVEDMRPTVTITRDARAYCYSYLRRLGDLFVVEGLK